ncbi:hypothetical protein [Falsiruegeria mediterranea]|uniref:hypothetical protein n=1 Tax=Falsiruegeria mediterranea TaxID=1280832 RepID=UPI0015F24E60|nr:hypothetical protein [Falsiruegeria mediterranea]
MTYDQRLEIASDRIKGEARMAEFRQELSVRDHFRKKKIHERRSWDWDTEEARRMHNDVTNIIELHFSKFGPHKFSSMTSYFLAVYEAGLAEVWCREEERKKLAKLSHQIRKLAETFNSIHWMLQMEMKLNATLPLEVVRGKYVPSKDHEEYSVEANDFLPKVASRSLELLSESFEHLLPAIEKTSLEVPEGIQYKKRAIEAWRLVEAAAAICRGRPGTINVPKSLNPTSPFHKLLEDLFDLFEITTTPEGAFSGWYSFVDNNREELDLLPM